MQTSDTILGMIRAAAQERLPQGWIYLPEGAISPDTKCILISDVAISELQDIARSLGFPVYGLDTRFLQIIAESATDDVGREFSDEELVRAYVDQLKFSLQDDRRSYDSLGPERPEVACGIPDCDRHAISLSVFCRPHHFESVKRNPCAFSD